MKSVAQLGPARILTASALVALAGFVLATVQCSGDSPGSEQVECDGVVGCPLGFVCESGHCVADADPSECIDPDDDGFCDCCAKGNDCPGAEDNPMVHPGATEHCDGLDNDCDGQVDNAPCALTVSGVGGDEPFDLSSASPDLVQNPDGSVTLASSSEATANSFAWPSNDDEGTVSRIDMLLNVEVARYVTVLRIPGGNPADPTGTPPVSEWDSGCNRPSRSTVDLAGNAYVANRAHNGSSCSVQGSVTKIGFYDKDLCAASLALCQCVDRDGNGTIETSKDVNGDDEISLGNPDEFFGYGDECVLWTVPIGASNSNARAMAIDADGFVWVGDWQGSKFFKLDPKDGQLVNPVDPNQPATGEGIDVEGRPYGAAIDSNGLLWYLHRNNTGSVGRIDTSTGKALGLDTSNPTGGYGITVDRQDQVWLASLQDAAGGGTVARYHKPSLTWTTYSAGLGAGTWAGRGITATAAGKTATGAGIVWAVFNGGSGGSGGSTAHLVGFDDDSGAVWDHVDLTDKCGANTSIGVGIGIADSVWVVNKGSDNACRYDPPGGIAAGEVVDVPIGDGPYTYSDFTGNLLRTFTARKGTFTYVIEGCPEPTAQVQWTLVTWEAQTPGKSSVAVRVRNADTIDDFSSAPSHGPAIQPPDQSFDLTPLELWSPFVEIEVVLEADVDGNAPTLSSIKVGRECYEDPV